MKRLLYILLFQLALSAAAQQISVPYFCGFEESEDLSYWHLNDGTPSAPDQWVIGEATRSQGRRSLYISNDKGINASYSAQSNIVIAYRRLRFPKQQAYEISFDWKCEGDYLKSELYVWVGLANRLNDLKGSETSGTLPNSIKDDCRLIGSSAHPGISGSLRWQNASLVPNINLSAALANQEFVLAFIWVSNYAEDKAGSLGACIDNLQIAKAIPKPTDVKVEPRCEDSTLLITWQSSLSRFNIEYKNINSDRWRHVNGIDDIGLTHSYALGPLPEGAYDVRIKGSQMLNGQADTSVYACVSNTIMYCPDQHCINYVDLHDPNTVCTYGTYNDPLETVGVLDYGPGKESRHTVIFDKGVYDPRTENKLLIVPQDALAVVRLGNWDIGAQAESITYSIVVDSASQPILLLRYAVVLEEPGHDKEDQPFFQLEVLSEKGGRIDPDCGVAEFYAGYGSGKWNNIYIDPSSDQPVLTWKDWTTVGLNLAEHHGETIKVRLITKDCAQSGHYGYAYFTLDCISAALHTDNCGYDPTITVDAPDGFRYEWTNEADSLLGTDREITVSAARQVYTCTCYMLENEGCHFSLSTRMAPRFPQADFEWEWVPDQCKNYIRLKNKSHVVIEENGQKVHTDELCETYQWDCSNGQSTALPSPLLECNPDGETVDVTLTAYLSGETCADDTTITIKVPSIRSRDVRMKEDICEGGARNFAGEWLTKTGVYQQTLKNRFGCDSLIVLHLDVHPVSPELWLMDTVCSTRPYLFDGKQLTVSGDYEGWFKNRWGCDSIVHLGLTVVPQMSVTVEDIPVLCADEAELVLNYVVSGGAFDSLVVNFSEAARKAGFEDVVIVDSESSPLIYNLSPSLLPGQYGMHLHFVQNWCDNADFWLPFELRYASSVIEQKWNDVLWVTNNRYNGGYNFTAYQWYRDGLPIPDATSSYLYEPLVTASEYTVMLWRADGTAVLSCPFVPTVHTDISLYPTLMEHGQRVPVRMAAPAEVTVFTLQGQPLIRQQLAAGEGKLTAPAVQGLYVLAIRYADGRFESKTVLVK